MEKNIIPLHSPKRDVSLDELSALCQDDNWLENLIQNKESSHMINAPSRLKEETLDRLAAAESSPKKFIFNPRRQLFQYSLRVSAAAIGAIILLFSAPDPMYKSPFDREIPMAASFAPGFTYENPAGPEHRPSKRLKDGIHNFSNSVQEFSNDLFNREVSPYD